MTTRAKLLVPLAASLWLALAGCGQRHQAEQPGTSTSRPVAAEPGSTRAPAQALGVDELADKPGAHLGRVIVVGVVATTEHKLGFVLIDSREYKECGLSCFTEAGTRKIPVRWAGPAPKVGDEVRVDGALTREAKGYVLAAEKVGGK